MSKRHARRFTEDECKVCAATISKLRAEAKSHDAAGWDWIGPRVDEALRCPNRTVEAARRYFVLGGFERAFDGERRAYPPVPELSDCMQEAHVIALSMGSTPKGFRRRLLGQMAREVIELVTADLISRDRFGDTFNRAGSGSRRCN